MADKVDKETKEALKSLGPLATLVGKSAGTLAGVLVYLAINNLVNPHYPALGDVVARVQELNKPKPTEVVQTGSSFLR